MELCPSLPVQIQEKQCDLHSKAFIENGLANNAVLLLFWDQHSLRESMP